MRHRRIAHDWGIVLARLIKDFADEWLPLLLLAFRWTPEERHRVLRLSCLDTVAPVPGLPVGDLRFSATFRQIPCACQLIEFTAPFN